jgi:hypothetical protein
MGVELIDMFTLGHFMMGFISYTILDSIKITTSSNMLLSNGLHLCIEMLEHNKTPGGLIIETNKNHIGDIVGFLLGWLISFILKIKVSIWMYPILWVFIIYVTFMEIYREVFPDNVLGAFTKAYRKT